MEQTFVIVGAGQAGGRAAETLREEGFDGRVVLIGSEDERPYERPPLSKGFLLGATARERLFLQPAPFYAEQQIELLPGVQVRRIVPDRQLVEFENGEGIRFDRLLIATGVRPRQLRVPGADLPGIVMLRTLRDAEVLSAALAGSPRVVLVGAGFIGAEIAAACRARGLSVTLIEALATPLQATLGAQVGEIYAAIHRDAGVDLRLQEGVVAFHGTARVESVALRSGGRLPCDLVVIGIGTVANTELLEGSALQADNGIIVDEFCRASMPHVYAAGDVARWWHPALRRHLRVEHWENAELQGRAAARAMLGILEPYAPVPYFWSDQYEYALQYLGHHSHDDQQVLRGSLAQRAFTLFYLREGVPVAALILNRPRDGTPARRLIAAGLPVDSTRLADDTIDLRSLARRP